MATFSGKQLLLSMRPTRSRKPPARFSEAYTSDVDDLDLADAVQPSANPKSTIAKGKSARAAEPARALPIPISTLQQPTRKRVGIKRLSTSVEKEGAAENNIMAIAGTIDGHRAAAVPLPDASQAAPTKRNKPNDTADGK